LSNEKYVKGNDLFQKASEVANPPLYHGKEDVEVLDTKTEPCHKGEAMREDGTTYIVEGQGCPYPGSKVVKVTMEITDAKGNKRQRVQSNYYCAKCRDDFEKYKVKPKARSIDEVRVDAKTSSRRLDPNAVDRRMIRFDGDG
jgi:hypothetical protein